MLETNMNEKLDTLCTSVRNFCNKKDYEKCLQLITKAMGEFPHSAVPHNLLGVVLEKEGDHLSAMRHFRAAWALDPTYRPANWNLNKYGTFCQDQKCAFDESDVLENRESTIEIVYDEKGIGHAVSKYKITYDEKGFGKVIGGNK